VKSVSALWAIAPQDVAEQIAAAHRAAVKDALAWPERDAVRTRGGRNGVQQLDTTGMLAAAFEHRDSRAGGTAQRHRRGRACPVPNGAS